MKRSLSLAQVLLFRDASASQEQGEILWAALKEVEAFYRRGGSRLQCRRFYLAAERPPTIVAELGSDANVAEGADLEEFLWQKSEGRYSHTFDQQKLSRLVRSLLPSDAQEDLLLLITDQELSPPKNWRYIIWDEILNGAAVSIKPTDPAYWRIEDHDRLATIKHRVRTACLSAVGASLGLSRCSNAQCFLYKNVDSVLRLDAMMFLGPEHNWPELKMLGYLREPRRPAAVQRIVDAERLETW